MTHVLLLFAVVLVVATPSREVGEVSSLFNRTVLMSSAFLAFRRIPANAFTKRKMRSF